MTVIHMSPGQSAGCSTPTHSPPLLLCLGKQKMEPCHPHWKPGWNSTLLTSAGPAVAICSHLGNETGDRRSLSLPLCNSSFKINNFIKSKEYFETYSWHLGNKNVTITKVKGAHESQLNFRITSNINLQTC